MDIQASLKSFSTQPLLIAARSLFKDTLKIPLSPLADSPITPQRFFRDAYRAERHDSMENLFLVGRITDDSFHAATQAPADLDTAVAQAAADDYNGMFLIAADLGSRELTRSDLAARTREINRTFSAPVIVVFSHTTAKHPVLSIGVASRRPHKRDKGKDVLGKVSMIREIHLETPHRGHLEILKDFSLAELEKNGGKGKRGHRIDSFKSFHAALEQIFNTDLLNKNFYAELSNWYFWALPQVDFPNDLEKDDEKRRATGLIRLLTRLIFCWFLKEKNLIPEKLFHPADLAKLLKGFDPESETSSTYYQAILQNLFFATLNQRMGKDGKGNPYRVFATDEGFQKNKATYDVNNLYRYEKLFTGSQEDALAHFADIPFLNGGLFECLDRTEDGTDRKLYLDGFSRNAKKRPHIPDRLFFDSGETADLSGAYGDKNRKSERVTGLISILNRYKFTIVENTPIDQEIALDPELLGKVFENLLASYNEETKTTARKQTGSFYTPRPIVDYMVDESLKAHLERKLTTERTENTEKEKANSSSVHSVQSVVKKSSSSTIRQKLDDLFAYTEKEHAFTTAEVASLIAAIDALKILDPACGSGAFPMGVLHKLVYILTKLDPDNDRWKNTQLAKLDSAPMREELERAFADNNDDYGRKLYLIENCLYGVDIQPIAIQITKLRFFISLVCDQKTNRNKKDNHGIRPLPNLETKFVAANTLIGLPIPEPDLFIRNLIEPIEKEIETAYHGHFTIQRRDQKLALQRKIKTLRQNLTDTLLGGLGANKGSEVAKKAQHLADWDPFDPQSSADFFDPHWMFGRSLKEGFDVVIGNPPYVFGGNIGISANDKKRFKEMYVSGAGKTNLFVIFIERGAQLLREDGLLSYILPNTLLRVTSYDATRRLMLTKYCIEEILDLDVGVFDQVTASTIAIRIRASVPGAEWKSIIRHGLEDKSAKYCKQEDWQKKGGIIDIFSNQRDREILELIEAGSQPLGDMCHRIRFGVVISGNLSEVVSNEPLGSRWKPFLEGDEIAPYAINYRGRFLNYDESLLHRSRTPDVFECRKIMIQRITGGQTPLKAALDDEWFYNKESILNLILNEPYMDMYEFILALLNSKTANWFYRKRFTNDSKLTVNLSKEYVSQIPVKSPSADRLILFQHLVRLLMHAKRSEQVAASQFLEDLIDACVMESYFREHMAERDLLFHDTVAQILEATHTKSRSHEEGKAKSEFPSAEFLRAFVSSCETSPIHHRLDRICTASPDLLAIIKQEGKV